MRLLLCTDTWLPQINGVSIVSALTAQGLTARGWRCEVVGPRYPQHPGEPHTSAHCPVTSLPSVAMPTYPDVRLSLPWTSRIERTATRFRPHVVHCATEFTVGWSAQRVATRLGIPVTTSYHTDFGRYTEAYGVPWLRSAVTSHLTRFHRRARLTFTPSHASRAQLEAMGITHVVRWGCGVDTTLFHPRHRNNELRSACASPDACIFLHVGRLAPEKGVDRIVTAFHHARRQLPAGAMHLIVAGTGPMDAEVRRLGTDHVTFLGTLDRDSVLPRLYASADVFVFSSLTETLGLVVLEAMASGLPVIASPAGGVAEHLVDGVNGLAYPPADVTALTDRMLHLARDSTRRKQLAKGARTHAGAWSWESELDRLDAQYRALIATGGSPSSELGAR
jgi:glycosyltransferase involved in cell wall biosynthesis